MKKCVAVIEACCILHNIFQGGDLLGPSEHIVEKTIESDEQIGSPTLNSGEIRSKIALYLDHL